MAEVMSDPMSLVKGMPDPKALVKEHVGFQEPSKSSLFGMHDEWAWQSPMQAKVRNIITSWPFEYSMVTIIVVNVVLIIIETDYLADDAHDSEPWFIAVPSGCVLLIFVIEMTMRLYSERWHFFKDEWSIFDLAIVSLDFIFSSVALILGSSLPISVLRVLRLCKVARVSQLFRFFKELKLMMIGLMGAIRAMFWGTILMFITLLVLSICAVQLIHPLNVEVAKTGAYDGCDRCGRAYHTVMAATLTISQHLLFGDSWGEISIPIIENYPATSFFFAAVYLIVGLAILNLLLGVIVDVAQDARKRFEHEQEHQQRMKQREKQSHLMKLCCDMDGDQSGYLTKEELFEGYENSLAFRKTLQELGVEREDMEIVWICLDTDRSGNVSYSEFVDQLYSMKTSDAEFMLSYIKYYVTVIKNDICAAMDTNKKDMVGLMEKASTVEEVESKKLDLLADIMRNEKESIQRMRDNDNDKLDQLIKGGFQEPSPQVFTFPARQNGAATTTPSVSPGESLVSEIKAEIRKNQAELSQRLIDMERKVERSMSMTRPTGAALSLWQVPTICQHVTPASREVM